VATGWLAAGIAAAGIPLFLLYEHTRPPEATEAPRTAAATPTLNNATDSVTIAVLPFLNLSGDASQEYLSDGITEEITSALAHVPGLTVLARTSAFEYKGKSRDVRAIGGALGARYLIEGSVQKDVNRVRISAQLVQVTDGAHVWAETYDRQLTDLFRTEDDIAHAIASSLRIPLGLTRQALVRPKDEQTYELFLRGRAALRARRGNEALDFMEQVVARDANFAPGWRFLGQARNMDNIERSQRREQPRSYPEGRETLARKVIALAPDSADGYVMLANLAWEDGQKLEALELHKQAFQRDPNDPELLNAYANELWELGYLKEALDVRERQHRLEPLVPIYNFLRAETAVANGLLDRAADEWLALKAYPRAAGLRLIAPLYAREGRFDDAVEVLLARKQFTSGPFALPPDQIDAAVQVLRAVANKTPPPAPLPDFRPELAFVYAYTDTPERILDHFERGLKAGVFLRYVWWPMPSSVRKTERFKTLARNAGFVQVWQARGWPDLCRPVGADDFACD